MKQIQNMILLLVLVAGIGALFYNSKTKTVNPQNSVNNEEKSQASATQTTSNKPNNSTEANSARVPSSQSPSAPVEPVKQLEGPAFEALKTALQDQNTNQFWDMSSYHGGTGQWTISGEGMNVSLENGKGQITQLANLISSHLQLNQHAIEPIPNPIDTNDLQTYTVGFDYEGVPVYSAQLKVTVNKERSEVNIIQFDTIPVKKVINTARLSGKDVENFMANKFTNRVGDIKVHEKPVLDVDSEGQGRNVWLAVMKTQKPDDTRQYFVDAETGTVLRSFSLIIKN